MPRLCTRELLYTALTRAKKMVVIVGSEHYVQSMVDNNLRPTRYTGLREWIEGYEPIK
jgi:exodeoxyribonuclease V alpha subunit